MKQDTTRSLLELVEMVNVARSFQFYSIWRMLQSGYELAEIYRYWKFSQSLNQLWQYRNTDNFDSFQVGSQLAVSSFENDYFLLNSNSIINWLKKVGFLELDEVILRNVLKDDMCGFTTYYHPELNIVFRVVENIVLANVLFAKKVVASSKEENVLRRRNIFSAVVAELLKEQEK